ncbi:type II secretion system minor pseudopilin GspH [Gallaecimonas sp. GXIMD4217]|uniref:type II secretion system minor pseudopilin GspH n=1 Tax=Gallaecimonas sp. GXIMD4217 TaxID=3131927 RepID=UPI00311AE602
MRQARGFTLLEIMVVVMLIGLAASLVAINFGGETAADRLDKEARAWLARLELLRDEAVMQGRELGLRLDKQGKRPQLEPMRFTEDGWQKLESDRLLSAWPLAEGIRGAIKLDGLELGPSLIPEDAFAEEDADDEAERLTPHLFFLSSGELLPFELCLTTEDEQRRELVLCIQGQATGGLSLVDDRRASDLGELQW